MQLFKDEKMKHRVVGLAVLMSIALILVPAMVKKSNQRLDRNLNLTLNLPPKPSYPAVEAPKPEVLFKEMKVAQVQLQAIKDNQRPITVSKAESLSGQTMATRSIIQKSPMLQQPVVVAKAEKRQVSTRLPVKVAQRAVIAKPAPAPKSLPVQSKPQRTAPVTQPPKVAKFNTPSGNYSVQVASFSREDNAVTLVRSLQQKGFKATYEKQGGQYRVLVGERIARQDANYLKHRLASAAQLSGFIVKVG